MTYLPGAPTSNFGTPTPFSDAIGYDIYLMSTATTIFGYLQSRPDLGGAPTFSGANLYFDVNTPLNGSDIGFEITNSRAFVPGVAGYSTSPLPGLAYAFSSDGTGLEFSLANSLFTGPIAGAASGVYGSVGDTITLRLSQAFGYSVGGGATYGDARLGQVRLGGGAVAGAVPEPATWGMMLLGFGAMGYAMRRRAKVRTTISFA